jgi:hypothetical protein
VLHARDLSTLEAEAGGSGKREKMSSKNKSDRFSAKNPHYLAVPKPL